MFIINGIIEKDYDMIQPLIVFDEDANFDTNLIPGVRCWIIVGHKCSQFLFPYIAVGGIQGAWIYVVYSNAGNKVIVFFMKRYPAPPAKGINSLYLETTY